MTPAGLSLPSTPQRRLFALDLGSLSHGISLPGPKLLFGLRLWASVCLALYVAFWLQLDNAYWAGTAAAVCQPHLGASLRKAWHRMIGTIVGAVAIVVLTWCFPQNRHLFLVGLALWGAGCAAVATLLRNFAAYTAALAGVTAAIIASDQLRMVGGPNGDAFMLAITRASEICIGIVCAGIVLAGTDFGASRRRLATLFADLSFEITRRFAGTLASSGSEFTDTQPVRREFVRRVIALDPVIDEAFGESSQLRYHATILQRATDGLFAALAGWRTVAARLVRLPPGQARQEADSVLRSVPQELRAALEEIKPTDWAVDPIRPWQACEAGARSLIALPAGTPSLRLLADQTTEVLAGISRALNGLALLVADPARPAPRRGRMRFHLPDWLPALVNGGRAFVMIGAAELFWIFTAWPNGASAITWVAITVILFATRADQAYASAFRFVAGNVLAIVLAAIVEFALLPQVETFAGFCFVIGLVLIPAGALSAQPWQASMFTAMAANFVPILAPANEMSYDTIQFYNAGLAIVLGSSIAALSFRVLPPLSPAFRTRRLLALTLRDLQRLARAARPKAPEDWQGRVYARLSTLPEGATPLQRAQLLAALSVGTQIVQLRHIVRRLGLSSDLVSALTAFCQGNGRLTCARLARLDQALASNSAATATALRARGLILGISEALTEHAAYFYAGGGA